MTERRTHHEQQAQPESLSSRLEAQVDTYLAKRGQTLERRGMNWGEDTERFLRANFNSIIAERNERADDNNSPEGKRAAERAQQLLPTRTYFVDCIDGRISRLIKYGIAVGFGSAIQRPAGDMPEFAPAADGGVLIYPGSYFAEVFDNVLEKASNNSQGAVDVPVVTQVLDSHIECAAQGKNETAKGRIWEDGGLYQDVIRKKEMADEMMEYVKAQHEGKRVIPIQTSFDPETAFMYMGLERDEVLMEGSRNGGFTEDTLSHLSITKKIIHTRSLLEDPIIRAQLEQHQIPNFNWRRNYRQTLAAFWEQMETMVDNDLLDHIGVKVKNLYPDADELEIQERSMLLALNTYNAYHLNSEGRYAYSKHRESWISTGEGENGPYKENQPFSVFSKAPSEYDVNVGLAASIIRQNRDAKRILDKSGIYPQKRDFYDAPVPDMHSVVIRDESTDWDNVRRMVQTPGVIPDNWFSLRSDEFMRHVGEKFPSISVGMFTALNTLRREMIAMHDHRGVTGQQIFDGAIDVLPVLVDKERKVQAIVPFVHPGFSRG